MKIANTVIGIFLFSLGAPVFALPCDDVSGDYINVSDTANPEVKLRQIGCESITLTDNSGVDWTMKLDGTPNSIPKGLPAEIHNVITDGSYTVTRNQNYPDELKIVVHGTVNLVMPITKTKLAVEIEYTSRAYLLDFQKKGKIQLETDSFKLLSVTDFNGAIVGGQVQGFLQGANLIANAAKHSLDVTLKIRQ